MAWRTHVVFVTDFLGRKRALPALLEFEAHVLVDTDRLANGHFEWRDFEGHVSIVARASPTSLSSRGGQQTIRRRTTGSRGRSSGRSENSELGDREQSEKLKKAP